MKTKMGMILAMFAVGCADVEYEAGTDDLEALAAEDGKADTALKPAPQALPLVHHLTLPEYEGRPMLEVMLTAGTGIKANLDDDFVKSYAFADWNHVHDALYNFDGKVVGKVLGSFTNRSTDLKALVKSLAGKTFTPATLVDTLFATPGHGRDVYTTAEVIAMASGAGTLVQLDGKTYYYNYGYASGAVVEEDVKTGRSFGASAGHPANDASDTFYLRELGRYLNGNTDVRPFFQAMAEILTLSKADGIAGLSPLGQAVLCDFTAIYTAESDRHVMAKLGAHAWENDLAEVTMVAAWGTAVGKVMQAGKIVTGTPDMYWAMSTITPGRSGIGETRTDRRLLQRMITDYERTNHPKLVKALETAMQYRASDSFRTFTQGLNDADFLANPTLAEQIDGAAATMALTDLVVQVRTDAQAMLTTPAFQALMTN
jgi:hypothetical protein